MGLLAAPQPPKIWTCKVLVLLGPCGTGTALPIFDWKCLTITRAVAAMLSQLWVCGCCPSTPHTSCDMLRTF